MKAIINFFRNHFDRHQVTAIIAMAIIIAIMYQLNRDVLSMTQGHYNMFEILFI